jgi:multiple sugar transport system substrate-binding protein
MKKLAAVLLSTALVFTLSACGGSKADSDSNVSGGKKVTVDFWSAPNTKQLGFWNKMATEYAKDHPNVEIKVSQMPESPTSEAGIQSAIASGTAPTMSENITRGFAAQLAENKAIVNIGESEQFKKVVTDRKMDKTISNWKLADGSQYVMPVFSISDMVAWRTDILKELGVNEVPKTYSEVLAVGEKLKAKYPDKFLYFNDRISQPTYYFRWTDFFMFYNAATNGNVLVDGDKLVADSKAATNVFTFFKKLADNKYLLSQKTNDAFETGLAVSRYLRTSDVATWKDKFPNLKFGENYAVAPVPVPDGGNSTDVKTFADSKGLVVYASATKEQRTAALDFMQWLLTNPQHDLELMQATYNPPARDDVATNEIFKTFLDENPAIKVFGEQVPNGIPTMNSPKMVDIHTILGEKGVNPVVNSGADPAAAWTITEEAIQAALSKK